MELVERAGGGQAFAGQFEDDRVGDGDELVAQQGGDVGGDEPDHQPRPQFGDAVAGLQGFPAHHHHTGADDGQDEADVHHRQGGGGDVLDLRQDCDVRDVQGVFQQQPPQGVEQVEEDVGQPVQR